MARPRRRRGALAKALRRPPARTSGKPIRQLTPAQADRLQRRQLNEMVSWTVQERLRCLWYELGMAAFEMNNAAYWMVDDRVAVPGRRPERD